MASFQVRRPSSIPTGSLLNEIRVGNNGELVTLLYANPIIPSISLYGPNVGFAILQMTDPKLNMPSYLPNGFKRVKINVNSGFGRESGKLEFYDRNEPGQLQWWQGGVHFVILANLPIEQLKNIAESMEPI